MKNHFSILAIASVLAFGGIAVIACSDDSSGTPTGSSSGSTLNPDSGQSSSGTSGTSGTSGSSGSTDGGCPNTPANCFCGTPTTQAQFLNRCTTAAAIPVTGETVKPATTANIP